MYSRGGRSSGVHAALAELYGSPGGMEAWTYAPWGSVMPTGGPSGHVASLRSLCPIAADFYPAVPLITLHGAWGPSGPLQASAAAYFYIWLLDGFLCHCLSYQVTRPQ